MKCKVTKIKFELPLWNVPDWDDEMRTVMWKDITGNQEPAAQWPEKEKVRSKMANKATTAFPKRTTITPSLLAEQLLLPLDTGQP